VVRVRLPFTDPIVAVDGVPHWFTRLAHIWFAYQRCQRGHEDDAFICRRCGAVLDINTALAGGTIILGKWDRDA
jgi:hypothetical protein